MRRLILASASPRRGELLKVITSDFLIRPAAEPEVFVAEKSFTEAAQLIAKGKAAEIAALYPEDIVIGADTIVVIDNKALGKPRDRHHAFEMLTALSGREHAVITGVSVFSEGREAAAFSESTAVEFYALTAEEIDRYIATGEPDDKAGAYGIQEQGALLVKRIDGDFYNVMGLPIARLSRELVKIK